MPDIRWHGVELDTPQWQDPEAQVLAFTLASVDASEPDLHVILNMSMGELSMQLPVISGREWHLAINTAEQSPADAVIPEKQMPIAEAFYLVPTKSVVIFEGRKAMKKRIG